MAALAWIVSIGSFLTGLGLWDDAPRGHQPPFAFLLFGLSLLACPYIWDHNLTRALFSGRERAMACVAMLLVTPLILGL